MQVRELIPTLFLSDSNVYQDVGANLLSRILWSHGSKTGYYMETILYTWYKSSIKSRIFQAFSSSAGLLVIYFFVIYLLVSGLEHVHVCGGKAICSACWSTWAHEGKLWHGPCDHSCPPVHEDARGAKAETPRSWGVSGCAGIRHGARAGKVRSWWSAEVRSSCGGKHWSCAGDGGGGGGDARYQIGWCTQAWCPRAALSCGNATTRTGWFHLASAEPGTSSAQSLLHCPLESGNAAAWTAKTSRREDGENCSKPLICLLSVPQSLMPWNHIQYKHWDFGFRKFQTALLLRMVEAAAY